MSTNAKVILGVIAALLLGGIIYAFFHSPGVIPEGSMEMKEEVKDSSEIIQEAMPLYVSSNPEAGANDNITTVTNDLSKEIKKFTGLTDLTTLESAAFDKDGNAYVTAGINTDNGAIVTVKNFAEGSTIVGGESKLIRGGKTGLGAPKGLYVSDSLKGILVADFKAKNIKMFNLDASGDVSPTYTIGLGNTTRSIWDVTYVESDDTLYGAGTDGTVLVYEQFSQNYGKGGPTKTFVPANQNQKISVNLHGIDTYRLGTALYLVLSDVGDAASNADGQIFVIENPAAATGNAQVIHRIGGVNSKLGNPVDLVVDSKGGTYVAEKSNDMIFYYTNLFSNKGGAAMDMASNKMYSFPKPESVSLGSEE